MADNGLSTGFCRSSCRFAPGAQRQDSRDSFHQIDNAGGATSGPHPAQRARHPLPRGEGDVGSALSGLCRSLPGLPRTPLVQDTAGKGKTTSCQQMPVKITGNGLHGMVFRRISFSLSMRSPRLHFLLPQAIAALPQLSLRAQRSNLIHSSYVDVPAIARLLR